MPMRTLLAICASVAVLSPAQARLLENWPYDKLMKESDLVVIAQAGKTATTKDDIGPVSWKSEFVGQNTTLKVLHVLHGKHEGKEIKVLHFRMAEDHFIISGPCFIALEEGAEYLLYLKRMKDGRYEPVSGRIDPVLAVRSLKWPSRPDDVKAVALAPAPKPAFEVTLKIDAKKNIHDEKFATVEIQNNTTTALDMKTNLPFGPLVFFDTEILDANKKRVSIERYWAMISSPYSPEAKMSAGTIPAGKSLAAPVRLFLSVEEKNRVPGKYTCRVRFHYDKINEVSGWVPFEVTAETLKSP